MVGETGGQVEFCPQCSRELIEYGREKRNKAVYKLTFADLLCQLLQTNIYYFFKSGNDPRVIFNA